ncbi:hypothetical protein NliqN6_4539 [Naganishia liquefaciens]|uniref:Uncharacterized protein n=1 Tax=Naganishia liquefaciens TaxID=104408 RepID=A0A8H3YHF4_9TREE|nr:hypothetical protein NliqN6_4539 [Naganishia liquefaciens]
MPLSRSVEILPAPGQYGAPKYMKFTKRDYRRDCYSVGNADVPYAAVQMQPGMSVVSSAAMTLPPMMGMSMLPMA